MTIEEALKLSGLPRLDAEVLLAHLLDKPREWLISRGNEEFTNDQWSDVIKRRKNNEPVAYITGTQEFYGRDFYVNEHVLIPRPSTEFLIDLFFDVLDDEEDRIRSLDTQVIGFAKCFGDVKDCTTVVDLCTGSGCIGVTIACEKPSYSIIATDVSDEALSVARKNARRHNVEDRMSFLQGNAAEPVADLQEPFIVITNPPYIPETETLMPDVADFEPHLALFGGEDGSDIVKKIYQSCTNHPFCRGLIMECRDIHAQYLC